MARFMPACCAPAVAMGCCDSTSWSRGSRNASWISLFAPAMIRSPDCSTCSGCSVVTSLTCPACLHCRAAFPSSCNTHCLFAGRQRMHACLRDRCCAPVTRSTFQTYPCNAYEDDQDSQCIARLCASAVLCNAALVSCSGSAQHGAQQCNELHARNELDAGTPDARRCASRTPVVGPAFKLARLCACSGISPSSTSTALFLVLRPSVVSCFVIRCSIGDIVLKPHSFANAARNSLCCMMAPPAVPAAPCITTRQLCGWLAYKFDLRSIRRYADALIARDQARSGQ